MTRRIHGPGQQKLDDTCRITLHRQTELINDSIDSSESDIASVIHQSVVVLMRAPSVATEHAMKTRCDSYQDT